MWTVCAPANIVRSEAVTKRRYWFQLTPAGIIWRSCTFRITLNLTFQTLYPGSWILKVNCLKYYRWLWIFFFLVLEGAFFFCQVVPITYTSQENEQCAESTHQTWLVQPWVEFDTSYVTSPVFLHGCLAGAGGFTQTSGNSVLKNFYLKQNPKLIIVFEQKSDIQHRNVFKLIKLKLTRTSESILGVGMNCRVGWW